MVGRVNTAMENHFCMDLSLDFVPTFHPLADPLLREMPLNKSWHFQIPTDKIDPLITGFMSKIEVWIPHAEVFYSIPGHRRPIHIDGNQKIGKICKINWVYGGTGSLMRWWEPKDPSKPPKEGLTIIGSKYCAYDEQDCNMVWESAVGFPSLVQAGLPHDMINSSHEPRWCMSYAIYDGITRKPILWDQAVERFSGFKA